MKRLLIAGLAGVALLLVALPATPSARAPQRPIVIDVRATSKGERFVPSRFAATPLRTTVIVVRNYTSELHTFTIPRIGLNVPVLPGTRTTPRTKRISFVAPYGGTFRWFCWPCQLGLHRHAHLMGGAVLAG